MKAHSQGGAVLSQVKRQVEVTIVHSNNNTPVKICEVLQDGEGIFQISN